MTKGELPLRWRKECERNRFPPGGELYKKKSVLKLSTTRVALFLHINYAVLNAGN